MNQLEIATFTIFKFVRNKRWAFTQMGLAPIAFKSISGLKFFKLMGSGKGLAFSLRPDFSRYALFAVWDNVDSYNNFLKNNSKMKQYLEKASYCQTVLLKAIQSKGTWEGNKLFNHFIEKTQEEKPIAVLTRATLKPSQLLSFWKNAYSSTQDLQKVPGLKFSIGVGELPYVKQATFSIWESEEAMKAFAYKKAAHQEVVRKTREKGWYSEELFARFVVLNDPLELYN